MSEIPQYVSKSKKTKKIEQLINEALYILDKFGVPLQGITLRRRERIGMAFFAVANVKQNDDWKNIDASHALRTRKTFRQFAPDIAWETEVWISQSPEHIIHFNGEKFLGPYSPKNSI